MEPTQIAQVQRSFKKVEPIAEQAAALFYQRLFELDPGLKPLFRGDMQQQGRKLMQMLAVAVNGLNRLDTIAGAVQELGKRHVAYGVKPAHYDTVGSALLWALEQGLGADFSPTVRSAWAEAYTLLSTVMKEEAAHVQEPPRGRAHAS
jgi:hemoglobin-like flavoprotein